MRSDAQQRKSTQKLHKCGCFRPNTSREEPSSRLPTFKCHQRKGRYRTGLGGAQNGGFQKSGFGGCSLDGDPPPPKPERGYKKRNDRPERGYKKRNDGTKNGHEGTFAKTALLQNHPFVSSQKSKDSDRSSRSGPFCRYILLMSTTFAFQRSPDGQRHGGTTPSWRLLGEAELLRGVFSEESGGGAPWMVLGESILTSRQPAFFAFLRVLERGVPLECWPKSRKGMQDLSLDHSASRTAPSAQGADHKCLRLNQQDSLSPFWEALNVHLANVHFSF